MAITQEDCDVVMNTVRNCLPYACNKMYRNSDTSEEIAWNNVVRKSSKMLTDWRVSAASRGIDVTSSSYGEYLARNNGRNGNCGENASLTLYYCQTVLPIAVKMQDLALVKAGEHTFVLASATPGGAQGFNSIEDFNSPRGQNAWAIDPWMGVACRASDFKQTFGVAAQRWKDIGIVYAENIGQDRRGNDRPNPGIEFPDFADEVLTKPLTIQPDPMAYRQQYLPQLQQYQQQLQDYQRMYPQHPAYQYPQGGVSGAHPGDLGSPANATPGNNNSQQIAAASTAVTHDARRPQKRAGASSASMSSEAQTTERTQTRSGGRSGGRRH